MSGFFGSNEASKWGGFLKQAISNVETTFDSLLEAPPNGAQQTSKARDGEMETETYMDPISGMVTTIEKPKTITEKPREKPREKPNKADVPRTSSDLSARLAAVMSEKKASPRLKEKDIAVIVDENKVNLSDKQPSTSKADKPNELEEESSKIVEEKNADETPKEKEQDVVEKEEDNTPSLEITKKEEEQEDELESKLDNESLKEKGEEEVEEPKEDNDVLQQVSVVEEKPVENSDSITKDQVKKETTKVVEELKKTPKDSSKDTILEQREQQLFQAMENIAKLHDQIHQLQEKETVYTSHISELEEKVAQHEQENSNPAPNTQKNVKRLEAAVEDLKKQITNKDEKIQGLLQEGEKLSKTELKHYTMIKKLRLEKTEQDKLVADLQKKLEKATTDLTESTQRGTKQTETEKRLQESVKLLSDLTEQQTKHINKLESEKILNKEKQVETELALQSALDSIEKEKAKAKSDAESASSAALEKEIKANDRLHKELTKVKEDADNFEVKLRKEIRELQIAIQTLEEQAGHREDGLRREVQELQTKLQRSDNRIDDISATVDEATAPLLRQIEELQTQHATAIKNRDQTEQSMILRMQSAELERSKTVEKQAKLQSEIAQVTERLTKTELDLSVLERENEELKERLQSDTGLHTALQAEMDALTKEKEELVNKETQIQETLKTQYQRLMKERVNEERKQFEIKLKAERTKWDNTRSQLSLVKEDDAAESAQISSNNSVSSRSSFETNSASHAVSSILVERLQANIRQLENQLSFYQTQLQSSSQSRDELSEEVLSMSIEIDHLRKQTKKESEMEKQHKELHGRYQTLLELLGERTEQVEELKADLNDVKEMYRNQTVELVQKIDSLSKK
ncbi:hypothetical protein K501DRAFT_332661 [Backusella circina FSU 941]|nr:hypothetical protein K501DRAFT_332661 [Backusella circina FSU 941]